MLNLCKLSLSFGSIILKVIVVNCFFFLTIDAQAGYWCKRQIRVQGFNDEGIMELNIFIFQPDY